MISRRGFLISLPFLPSAVKKMCSLPKPGTWASIERSLVPEFKNAPVVENPYIPKDYVFFITRQMNLHVTNPRMCGRIEGIGA